MRRNYYQSERGKARATCGVPPTKKETEKILALHMRPRDCELKTQREITLEKREQPVTTQGTQ